MLVVFWCQNAATHLEPQHSEMQFKLRIATVPALLCDKLKHYANSG